VAVKRLALLAMHPPGPRGHNPPHEGRRKDGPLVSFDINDRSTWDWRDGGVVNTTWFVDGLTVTPDPANSANFYQLLGGRPFRQIGPVATIFGYDTVSGQLINHPSVMDPEQFNQDTYQWCLDNGLVVEDQR
jgi:hypothetical protein